MAKGENIDELYMSLGLDLSQLDSDFIAADRTVSQNMANLNRAKTQIKLQAQIDLNNLSENASDLDRLKIKEKEINALIKEQENRVKLTSAAYKQMAEAKGATALVSQKLQTSLLKEENELAKLQKELRELSLNKNINISTNINTKGLSGAFQNVTSSASKAKLAMAAFASGTSASISQSLLLIDAMPGKIGKTAAAVGLLVASAPILESAIISAAKPAISAGDAVYNMAQKLHISTQEAAAFSRIFKLAGADVSTATAAFLRLDKQVLNAGANGNETTNMLKSFGVQLKNNQGGLLSYDKQLSNLAAGYKRAAQEGQAEAFVAQTLGARGQELIPILEQYNELKSDASKVQTTGMIDPQAAHESARELRVMEMELSQLKGTASAALLPVAKELMPDIVDQTKNFVTIIRDNKDDIKSAFSGMASAANSLLKVLISVGGKIGEIADWGNQNEWLKQQHPVGYVLNTIPYIGPTINTALYGDEYKQYKQAKEKAAAADKAEADKHKQINQSIQEIDRDTAQNAVDSNDKVIYSEKELEASRESAAKMSAEAEQIYYHENHSDLENKLYDIEQWKQAIIDKAKTAEESAAAEELAAARESQAYADAAKKTKSAYDSINSEIYHDTHNKKENAKFDIDQKARQYAEQGIDSDTINSYLAVAYKKAHISNNSGDNGMIIRGGQGGGQRVYNFTHDSQEQYNKLNGGSAGSQYVGEQALTQAAQAIPTAAQQTTAAIQTGTSQTTAALSGVQENINQSYSALQSLNDTVNSFYQSYSNNSTNKQPNNITVNVQIDSPQVDSDERLSELADKVSDKIDNSINNYLNSSSYGYGGD